MASAASTAPTKPLVSTIPSASKGISCILTFIVVEIKVDVRFAGANLSPQAARIKTTGVRDRDQRSDQSNVQCPTSNVPSSRILTQTNLSTKNEPGNRRTLDMDVGLWTLDFRQF